MSTTKDSNEKVYYQIAPFFLVFVFTLATQILVVLGTTFDDVTWSLFGNFFSWKVVLFMFLWAFASLWVSPNVLFELNSLYLDLLGFSLTIKPSQDAILIYFKD